MHTMHKVVLVGFVMAVAAACSGAAIVTSAVSAQEAAAGEPFVWEGDLAAGQRLEVINRNGRITAAPSTGRGVDVRGERSGDNADDIRIEVTEDSAGVTIEAIHPKNRPVRRWWPSSWFGRSPRVHFSVAVPSGVDFVARSRNGRIEADGLDGNADVETRNGSVRLAGLAGDARVVTRNGGASVIADGDADVQTRNGRVRVEAGGQVQARSRNGRVSVKAGGPAQARTRNGRVSATLGSGDWLGEATFESHNGSVTVRVPETMDADVSLRTVTGSVRTDLAIDAHTDERRHLAGRLGDGGRTIRLETDNGSVRLLAAE